MKKLYPQSIANILKNKRLLTFSVTEHALILQQLNGVLQKILPEPLAQHCQVANIHAENKHNSNTLHPKTRRHPKNIRSKTTVQASFDTIVLAVSSPSWSSRLRFQVPVILKALQQEYELPVQNIRILVSQHLNDDVNPDVGRIRPLEKTSQTFLSKASASKTLLSTKNAKLVRETAHSIENLDLRDSLIRLSRHSPKD